MQTALMLFDVKPQGLSSGLQKIAVKLPNNQTGPDPDEYGEFSDLIEALMAMTPDQLQDSLEQLEWVKVEGECCGYAPIIDLSQGQLKAQETLALLLGQVAEDNGQEDQSLVGAIRSGDEATQSGTSHKSIMTTVETIAQKDGILQSIAGAVGLANHAEVDSDDLHLEQNGTSVQENRLISKAQENLITSNEMSVTGEDIKLQQGMADQSFVMSQEDKTPIDATKVKAEKELNDEVSLAQPSKEDGVEKQTKRHPENDLIKAMNSGSQNEKKVVMPSNGQQFGEHGDQNAETFKPQQPIEKEPLKAAPPSHVSNIHQDLEHVDGAPDSVEQFSNTQQVLKETLHSSSLPRHTVAMDKGVEHAAAGERGLPAHSSDTQTDIIRQIVQRMTLRTQGAQSTMSIKLKPEFLGDVHMHVSTEHHQVVVRMAAESVAVKEMIEQGLQHLRSELQHHGLEIDKFEVFVANDNSERDQGQDLAGFRQALKRRNSRARTAPGRLETGGDITPAAEVNRKLVNATNEIDYFA